MTDFAAHLTMTDWVDPVLRGGVYCLLPRAAWTGESLRRRPFFAVSGEF